MVFAERRRTRMSTWAPVTVRVARRFSASPERVFDAWLDRDKVHEWMVVAAAVQPSRGVVVRTELDARVGGSFCFVDLRNGEELEHVGEYLDIDRPRRLVFTWTDSKHAPDGGRVTIEIVPLEMGCELALTHETRAGAAGSSARTEREWGVMLEAIAATLG
jgi:uncharacterized protein YndB with AHSA1/START domain